MIGNVHSCCCNAVSSPLNMAPNSCSLIVDKMYKKTETIKNLKSQRDNWTEVKLGQVNHHVKTFHHGPTMSLQNSLTVTETDQHCGSITEGWKSHFVLINSTFTGQKCAKFNHSTC